MECTDQNKSLLLSDFFTGHLGEDEAAQVSEHLSECRYCRIALRTMALIAGKDEPVEKGEPERHFSPTLLSRYYTDAASLDPKLVKRIEEHLQSCGECSEDLEFLQNSDIDLLKLITSRNKKTQKKSLFGRLFGWIKGY